MKKEKYLEALKICIYGYSMAWIFVSAFNIGFTGVYFALPGVLGAIIVAKLFIKKRNYLIAPLILLTICIPINLTLTINPLVFPILDGGKIEILKPGYMITYSDGSSGFSSDVGNFCNNCKSLALNPGDKFDVTEIVVTHPDFGEDIAAITKVGNFSENRKEIWKSFTSNKPFRRKFLTQIPAFIFLFPLIIIENIISFVGLF